MKMSTRAPRTRNVYPRPGSVMARVTVWEETTRRGVGSRQVGISIGITSGGLSIEISGGGYLERYLKGEYLDVGRVIYSDI